MKVQQHVSYNNVDNIYLPALIVEEMLNESLFAMQMDRLQARHNVYEQNCSFLQQSVKSRYNTIHAKC